MNQGPFDGRSSARRQRGLAAVLAILVVALAASVAIYLVWQQTVALRQVENLVARAQIREIARAGTSWAAAILSQDDSKVDHLNEPWAQPLPPIDVEQATLEGGMVDEQSKFNLNTVFTATVPTPTGANGQNGNTNNGTSTGATGTTGDNNGQPVGQAAAAGTNNCGVDSVQVGVQVNCNAEAFKILLRQLNLDPSLCDALIDWIDPDSNVTVPGGAEDSYYLAQDPPYRAANQPLASVGELRLIKGFTPQVVDRLAPFVTALPAQGTATAGATATTININTVTPDMVRVFMPDVNPSIILEARKRTPFLKADDLLSQLPDKTKSRLQSLIDTKSNFFSAYARVTQGRTSITYRAILQRGSSGSQWPTILSFTEEPM